MYRRGFILLLLLLLSGCIREQKLEDLGMVNSAAVDAAKQEDGTAKGNKITVAVAIPRIGPGGQTQVTNLQTESESTKEARRKLSLKTSQILVSGQLQNLIFGNELAKKGIWKYLDSYRRDYSVGEKIRIIIANGSAVSLLTHPYPGIPSISDHISALVEQEGKINEVPAGDLYEFVRDYYDDGIDPILPLIAQEKDYVQIDGIALFRDDSYKGKLGSDEAVQFLLMLKNMKNGEMLLKFRNSVTGLQERAMLSQLITKRSISVHKVGSSHEVTLNVRVSGIILEYDGKRHLEKDTPFTQLEQDTSMALREELQLIVNRLQSLGTDSLGFGIAVRNSMPYEAWKRLGWKTVYPTVPVKVNVVINVRDAGMIES
ncbi:Ger(x)C family spore germination protein [Paenibacillus lignilyticus]|uniref:Ger(X)C family spore germination protein n=1 Tax=Paenibacillus lignilyticus TaxID=1172615 RepID=A0ABS5C6M5_9BACL|nr:Ger(x)C family spore germination protein [Paenibacillus lignilyticus]MBP3961500.1 Ger(x)C family spore germination protein [Paenibacillus lignilyticus]